MPNPFYGRDVISVKDFSRADLEYLFQVTDKLEGMNSSERSSLLSGRILGLMFYEPSTRTRLSFEAAMYMVGGRCIGFSEPKTASIEKGENLADTVRTVENYADLLVLRHPMEGAARFAAEVASKPLINAGSGSEEHPTQAMLDLYTILKEKGRVDGLKIAVVGDLKYGRTVYSLIYALAKFSPRLHLVSPPQLKIRREVLFDLEGKVSFEEHDGFEGVIEDVDVLYVTRIQKERFPDPQEYEAVRGSYVVNAKLLEKGRDDLIVLHPLPRTGEVSSDVDSTPYAKYFIQMYRGRAVRSALLSLILSPQIGA